MRSYQKNGNKTTRYGRLMAQAIVVVVFLAWHTGTESARLTNIWTESDRLGTPTGKVVINKTWTPPDTMGVMSWTPPDTMGVMFDSPNLWIHVSAWGEGMANWMVSISELLILARTLNATLVEPCLAKGRLYPCGSKGATLAFRDVFDLSMLKEFYPHFISHEQFRKRTVAAPVIQTCMNRPYEEMNCSLTSRFRAIINPELENAMYKEESVLEILQYRRGAIHGLKHKNVTLVPKQAVPHVKTKYLRFKKAHYDLVDGLLEKVGIAKHSNFSVIHWRAELDDIDYLGCARDIIRARDFTNQKDTPFVLMSSLNTKWGHMWSGARKKAKNSQSKVALKSLMDSGFLKLDSMINASSSKDPGLLAVWDLIIATKANAFATCTGECGDFCEKCNYKGNFGRLAVGLRDEAKKESMSCWPENTSAVALWSTKAIRGLREY